jgi:tRNA-modifying protein YgfZ
MSEALHALQVELGARFHDLTGTPVARHYGDPASEYRATRDAAGVAVRSDLAVLRMWGKDPVRMLHGLVTNDVTVATSERGVYAVMLTPKGRTIAEMRVFRRAGEEAELLLVLPREALEGATAHLKKFVPPMFARWADVSADTAVLGAYGPGSPALLEEVLGPDLPSASEEAAVDRGPAGDGPLIAFTREAGGLPGYDLIVPGSNAPALWKRLHEAADRQGGSAIGSGALETLRVEAGRPRYGAELSEETIPTEAFEAIGWMPRSISFTKGCYTGQEVIVRIAHRGHVNRHLRGLLLGDAPAPPAKSKIFDPATGKNVGWITSTVISPLVRETIALAYVRREIPPGSTVSVGSGEGAEARVVDLPFSPPSGPA